MPTETVTVSKRGCIVLPAHIRRKLNVKPGARMLIHRKNNQLTLEAVPSFTQKLSVITRKTMGSTPEEVDEFIDQSRRERTDD
ncbi:AbrB/MazE/SpoVT family DNA-binding domain-containing protein [Desulfonatronospira sp.]|uniref:AbrB/MazE/SpoVT family DNA-binding domain-containing protein n=1 Tax=Desulfonatronospira sp. TaxID=1962951 RepID=UPI0025C71CDD|nr:AbrB/MazE/SpoVT family DNA-binding domain-containing protein [Desulfonatronospira sp.]